MLAEALAESITREHPAMSDFACRARGIDALLCAIDPLSFSSKSQNNTRLR
jgi:hypothetical protein